MEWGVVGTGSCGEGGVAGCRGDSYRTSAVEGLGWRRAWGWCGVQGVQEVRRRCVDGVREHSGKRGALLAVPQVEGGSQREPGGQSREYDAQQHPTRVQTLQHPKRTKRTASLIHNKENTTKHT